MSAAFSFENLPDGWRPNTLGGLFDVQQGKALSPEARGGVSRRPFLRTRNVLWGRLDLADVDTMSFDEGEASRLTLQDRDLLVCEGGEIGRTAIWRDELPGCLYQNHIHRLRRKTDEIDPLFVMYWLQAAFLQLALYEGIGNRTTIPNLSAARLKNLPIPIPSIEEQAGIVRVLSKLYEAVHIETARLSMLKALKCSTMARALREGMLGERLKDTPIGKIPIDWNVERLGDVAMVSSGGTPPKNDATSWSGPIPWVSPKDMKVERLADVEDHISENAAKAYSRIAPAAAILVVVRGMILAKSFPVALLERPMAFNQDMKAIVARAGLDPEYLLFAILGRSGDLVSEIGTSAHGTRRLGSNSLESFLLPIPPIDQQIAIGRTLTTLERRVEAAAARVRALTVAFSISLQALMTGRLRTSSLLQSGGSVHE